MTFIDFARLHGIIIDALPPIGVWKRYRTTDKPTSRNGAVKFMGAHGFVQNHATMLEVNTWRDETDSPIAIQQAQASVNKANQEIIRNNAQAAQKAIGILSQCKTKTHAYAAAKGFPDEVLNVWETEQGPVAVIPMRIGPDVVGCQLISEDGTKKFLFGQRSGHAQFIFDNKGDHYLCEGFATGLSIRHALKNLKKKYTIHVCFSAGNMAKVAANLAIGITVADNDKSGTGERVAREIGFPYWLSDVVGEDFNDAHKRMGLFAASQSLIRSVRSPVS
jgi:putative DNA primase/helicase